MYFVGNFSRLNYTYRICLAVHLKIINVGVPMSRFGLTPPPFPWFPPTASHADAWRACWRDCAHIPASNLLKALRCRTQLAEARGRAFGLSAQIGSLCNQKRIALPDPANAVSRERKERNRLPETERFHLGLKFCFQVHGRGGRGRGRGGVR